MMVRGLCEFFNKNGVPCDETHVEAIFCMAVAHAKKMGQGRDGVHKLVEAVYGPKSQILVPHGIVLPPGSRRNHG